MAKINPVKLKQEAEKLEVAGRPEQAIALYRQIVDDNPRDWNVINKIGDLYAKINRVREASEEYAKVADFYAKDGFLLKAIAIWRKVNKLDASAIEPYQNLAELYAKQGLLMEAKSQYQFVVEELVKRGRTREAGDVLGKMADVDPGDLRIRTKLIELYIREGNTEKAVAEHIALAEELNKKGHLAEALQVLEKGLKLDPRSDRIRMDLARVHLVQKNYDRAGQYIEEALQHSPSDTRLLARLGEAYLGGKKIEEAEAIFKRLLELNPGDEEARMQMGRVCLLQDRFDEAYEEFIPVVERLVTRREGDKAASLLQQVVQKNPSHVKTLLKLVDVYRTFHKDNAVSSTYSQLTEAYINQGQFGEAASVLEILVSREPYNQQHKTKLEFVRSKLSGARGAPVPPPVPPFGQEVLEEEFNFGPPALPPVALGTAPPPKAAPAPARQRPSIEVTGPLSDEDREFIEEHLAEGKVFRKYGLVDKAADQFDAVVARFSDNLEARQELREIYKEKGEPAKAAEQCLALAEILRIKGDEKAARQQEEEARGLLPEVSAPLVAPSRVPLVAEEEISLEEGGEALSLTAEEEEISLDVEEEVGEGAEIAVETTEEPFHLEGEVPVEEELSVPFLEEEPQPEEPPLTEFPGPLEEPSFEAGPFAASQEEDLTLNLEEEIVLEDTAPPAPAPVIPAAPPAPEARAARPAPEPPPPLRAARPAPEPPPPLRAAPPSPDVSPAVRRVLDEVEQYMSLGFVEDAKDALREISGRYPGHPAILQKSAELGISYEAPTPSQELPSEAVAEELVDLAPGEPFSEAAAGAPLDLSLEEGEPASVELAIEEAPEPEAPLSQVSPTDEALLDVEHALGVEPAGAEGEIDLAGELDELFGAQSALEELSAPSTGSELGDLGLADIFKEFKKGVDKQLGQEDYDTRYNLGIAYKEMGLIDEAIAEFQLAAKDENRLLECSSMLGICFLEKGMPKLAIKWFEKGLKVPGRSEEEYLGLRYDLAAAHEAAGDVETALSLFTELYGQDANFRDVAAKIRELRGARA